MWMMVKMIPMALLLTVGLMALILTVIDARRWGVAFMGVLIGAVLPPAAVWASRYLAPVNNDAYDFLMILALGFGSPVGGLIGGAAGIWHARGKVKERR